MATDPNVQQLTPYQQRLFAHIEQSIAALPAGTPDEEIQKHVERLLTAAVDGDIALELEGLSRDLDEAEKELGVLHAEHRESKTAEELERVRQGL